MASKGTGYTLYGIGVCFTSLSIFLQVLPISTADYLRHELSLGAGAFGGLSSAFLASYALMQIPGGVILDRFGLKAIVPSGLALALVGSILYMLCRNDAMLLASRLLSGAGCSIAYISAVFLAVKVFPNRSTLFIAFVEISATAGAVLAADFQRVLRICGWQAANLLIVVFTAILLGLFLFAARDMKTDNVRRRSLGGLIVEAGRMLKNRKLMMYSVYAFFTWAVIMSFAGYWLKNYLVKMHHFSEPESLTLVQAYWISFLAFSLVVGIVARNPRTCRMIIVALAVLGFLDFTAMAVPVLFNYAGLVAVVVLGGISVAGVIAAFSLVAGSVDAELSGTAIALTNTCLVLGGLFGENAFGFVEKHVPVELVTRITNINPHYYLGLLLYPLFTFIALVAVIGAVRTRRG